MANWCSPGQGNLALLGWGSGLLCSTERILHPDVCVCGLLSDKICSCLLQHNKILCVLQLTVVPAPVIVPQALQASAHQAQPQPDHIAALASLLDHAAVLLRESQQTGPVMCEVQEEEALLPRLEAFMEACSILGTVRACTDLVRCSGILA